LFSNTFSLCLPLVWDQVPHPLKTTSNIIVLYTLKFLDRRQEDKRFLIGNKHSLNLISS
jgi:hypothetical protein